MEGHIRVKAAAGELGVSPPTVYRMVANAVIGHIRVGNGRGIIFIPRLDLDSYRRSHTFPAADIAEAS